MNEKPNRESAYQLLCAYNKTPSLVKHGLAVEGVMRHFARLLGYDEDVWGVVGLLHDLDYEQFPDQHCSKVREILDEHGYDADFIHAVISHGWGLCSEVAPEHPMEKVLYTTDELTGLITAAALMRPSKSVMDMELKSVKKKFKDGSFAAGVNRDVVRKGCEMLGMELDHVINETLMGMREVADALGLGMA